MGDDRFEGPVDSGVYHCTNKVPHSLDRNFGGIFSW